MAEKDQQEHPSLEPLSSPPDYDQVTQVLGTRLRDSIAPFALEIDCVALRAWAKKAAQKRFRHSVLIKELKLWAALLKHHPISRVWINDPFAIMDAPSLTELVYAVGHHLKIHKAHHVEHAVSLPQLSINPQNIALLRGLEFNHIQVSLGENYDIDALVRLKRLLDEFKFEHISFELPAGLDPGIDTMQIMECLSFLSPSSLVLPPQHLEIEHLQHFVQVLMQFGYSLQAPHNIVQFRSPLYARPDHVLRLGPEAKSLLNGLSISNLKHPEHYEHSLVAEKLPIQALH